MKVDEQKWRKMKFYIPRMGNVLTELVGKVLDIYKSGVKFA